MENFYDTEKYLDDGYLYCSSTYEYIKQYFDFGVRLSIEFQVSLCRIVLCEFLFDKANNSLLSTFYLIKNRLELNEKNIDVGGYADRLNISILTKLSWRYGNVK